jgi:RNAse (barnase) inhibitor barstar
MKNVAIDGAAIKDKETFHRVFAEAFGFPSFYGNNLDAWIDCMSSLDDPNAEMSSIHVARGEQLLINLSSASTFKAQSPELWQAFLECVAFVNWRRTENAESPLLILSAYA